MVRLGFMTGFTSPTTPHAGTAEATEATRRELMAIKQRLIFLQSASWVAPNVKINASRLEESVAALLLLLD